MPKQWAFENVFPGSDTGHWGVHHDQARGAIGIFLGKCVGDHVADVVTDNVGVRNLKLIEDACEILGLVRLGFKSFASATVTLSGIELVDMMRKRQARYAYNPAPSLTEQFDILAASF